MKSPTRAARKKRAHVLWTPQEVESLQRLLEKKTPIKNIASKLGKTEKSIRRKCEWLGVSSATTYRKNGNGNGNGGENKTDTAP